MTQTLSKLSDELAQTVEASGPAVVKVDGRRRLPASGIVWSPDGVIVTANHVVERDDNIAVGVPGGKTISAVLVGRDPTTDVAVLRGEASGLTPAAPINTEDLRVGDLVLALGRPGQSVLATLGIVSALGEGWRTAAGGRIEPYLQTDVVMYPGFSGGPLVDSTGQALGMNTSALTRGTPVAVPTPTLRSVVETLLAHGRIRRGYLGVGAQPARLPAGLADRLDQETGLLLVSVEPDSPAEKGGLLMGDTVVAIDKQPTRHVDDLLGFLSGERVGTSAKIDIVRGGAVKQLVVVIGEQG